MIKILFICHGNICRSPMAEFIMKDLVEKAGCAEQFAIASAATSTEEIGNSVYMPARQELARHGICSAGKRAVQLKKSDYSKYDYLVAAEQWNIRNMLRILGKDPTKKICRLLDFTNRPRDISDPWYTGDFEQVYRDILEGCTAMLEQLTK